jgi:hypothetical protein
VPLQWGELTVIQDALLLADQGQPAGVMTEILQSEKPDSRDAATIFLWKRDPAIS